MNRNHSPLPFTIRTKGQYAITCPAGLVATMESGSDIKRKPDAEFIVRACNSHYELLEACRFALTDTNWLKGNNSKVIHRLSDAIAKAESL